MQMKEEALKEPKMKQKTKAFCSALLPPTSKGNSCEKSSLFSHCLEPPKYTIDVQKCFSSPHIYLFLKDTQRISTSMSFRKGWESFCFIAQHVYCAPGDDVFKAGFIATNLLLLVLLFQKQGLSSFYLLLCYCEDRWWKRWDEN